MFENADFSAVNIDYSISCLSEPLSKVSLLGIASFSFCQNIEIYGLSE